jgi:hypothetical protein
LYQKVDWVEDRIASEVFVLELPFAAADIPLATSSILEGMAGCVVVLKNLISQEYVVEFVVV